MLAVNPKIEKVLSKYGWNYIRFTRTSVFLSKKWEHDSKPFEYTFPTRIISENSIAEMILKEAKRFDVDAYIDSRVPFRKKEGKTYQNLLSDATSIKANLLELAGGIMDEFPELIQNKEEL